MRFLMKKVFSGGILLVFFLSLSSLWAQEKKQKIEFREITVIKGEKKGKVFKGDKLSEYPGGGEVSFWGSAFHPSGTITKVTVNGKNVDIFHIQIKPGSHEINPGQVDFVAHLPLKDGWTIKVVVHLKDGTNFSLQKEAAGTGDGMDSLLEEEVKKTPVKSKTSRTDSSSVLVSEGSKETGKFKKDKMAHLKGYFILSFQTILAFLALLGLLGILSQIPDLWKKEESCGVSPEVLETPAPAVDETTLVEEKVEKSEEMTAEKEESDSEEPVVEGYIDEMNLYDYVVGNPVNRVDLCLEESLDQYKSAVQEAINLIKVFGDKYLHPNQDIAKQIAERLQRMIDRNKISHDKIKGAHAVTLKMKTLWDYQWLMVIHTYVLEKGWFESVNRVGGRHHLEHGCVKESSNAGRALLFLLLFHEGYHRITETPGHADEMQTHEKTIEFARTLRGILEGYQRNLKQGTTSIPTISVGSEKVQEFFEPVRKYFAGAKFKDLYDAIEAAIAHARKYLFEQGPAKKFEETVRKLVAKHGRPGGKRFLWTYHYSPNTSVPTDPLSNELYETAKNYGLTSITINRTGVIPPGGITYSGK